VFTNVTVGALVVLAVLIKVVKGELTLKNYSATMFLTLLLFLYGYISLNWSPGYAAGLGYWQHQIPYILMMTLLVPLLVSSNAELRTAIVAVVILGVTLITLLLLFAEWSGRFVILQGVKTAGGNPLVIGQLAGYVILGALLLKAEKQRMLLFVLRWAVVAVAIVVAVKSGSRGQLIFALLLGVVMLGFRHVPSAKMGGGIRAFLIMLTGGAAIIGLGIWSVSNFSAEEAGRWEEDIISEQGSGRLTMAVKLVSVWFSSPGAIIFGLGNSASFSENIIGAYPHNMPIEILCEEGILGFAIYLMILRHAIRGWKAILDSKKSSLAEHNAVLILGALFFYELLLSLKQGNMIGNPLFFTFAILIAACYKSSAQKDSLPDQLPSASERSTLIK
jgi:hypothetical protein